MKIAVLNWDSDFFKKEVAKIQIDQNEDVDISLILNYCREQRFKLVYIFISSGNTKIINKLPQELGAIINKKLAFFNATVNSKNFENISDKTIVLYQVNKTTNIPELNDQLLKLAIAAGSFSRFKLDKRITENEFKKMYAIWIHELMNDNKNNRIIIATTFIEGIKTVIGFLAYNLAYKTYNIIFIAVSKKWQQKGIGKAMLGKMMKEAVSNEINEIRVETQEENIEACQFYLSCGFIISESNNIYHVHL